MSKPVEIQTPEQFSELLGTSRIVVADFYANWCGPCKQIAPFFEQLSVKLSRPNIATFVKINTEGERSKDVAAAYAVTALPTFIIFRDGNIVEKLKGADPQKLKSVVEKLNNNIDSAAEGGASSSGSGSMTWLGGDLPRGYSEISDVVDMRGSELLNAGPGFSLRTLFKKPKPAALDKKSEEKDWIESDTDEQLLLFTPFNSAIKLHTIQITSLPPQAAEDEDEDEIPMRPKTIKLFTNRSHNLGFDDAEYISATQEIEIGEDDWNANGTANLGLRFVNFQNISSLVLFVVDGRGDGEQVRIDRIRLIGESGEKREMGKLEKVGDEPGE